MTRLQGRGVSPGIAIGTAVLFNRETSRIRYRLASSGVERERQRLRAARERTRRDLEEISDRLARALGAAQASIFAAQILMLDDPLFSRRADDLIRSERINAEWALERAVGEVHEALAREGDAWVRERGGDIADVGGRVQRHLRPQADALGALVADIDPPMVLVADDLPPSIAAQLDWTRVRGLVCDAGSATSHGVILVRSFGVPVVVGLGKATEMAAPGQQMAIDGTTGEVVIAPSEDVLVRWRRRAEAATDAERHLDAYRDQLAQTADGIRIRLEANLEIADEVARVQEAGAEGIGLFRSEFLLDPTAMTAPSEDEQVAVYQHLLASMAPMPVTVRTFDAPDEGEPDGQHAGKRERFGVRGVRSVLHHDARFTTQVRALLRSAVAGRLRIMLPFVTTGDELRFVRGVMEGIAADLGLPMVPVGAMIEVPAAALTVDALAEHADFLSVGTNDLTQYTLAVDRTDERLARQYDAASPAVLRLLRTVAVGGRRAGCDMAVCGEMAGDPRVVPILIGLGFRALSVRPAAVPVVKQVLASLNSRQATVLARRALLARSGHEIAQLLDGQLLVAASSPTDQDLTGRGLDAPARVPARS
jgi:phosphotransferase system enzyme I (PtsI)